MTEQIADVPTGSRGTHGSPSIHVMLKRQGARCGRRRVTRLIPRPMNSL
ncbi:IS3 family transposase [Streptomyces sp. NPDC056227]